MQVFAEDGGRSRLVWVHDTLPDQLSVWLAAAMDQIVPVMKHALETSSVSTVPKDA